MSELKIVITKACGYTECKRTNGSEHLLKRCGRCRSIVYCGVECQKNDYQKHRVACRSMVVSPSLSSIQAKRLDEETRKQKNLLEANLPLLVDSYRKHRHEKGFGVLAVGHRQLFEVEEKQLGPEGFLRYLNKMNLQLGPGDLLLSYLPSPLFITILGNASSWALQYQNDPAQYFFAMSLSRD